MGTATRLSDTSYHLSARRSDALLGALTNITDGSSASSGRLLSGHGDLAPSALQLMAQAPSSVPQPVFASCKHAWHSAVTAPGEVGLHAPPQVAVQAPRQAHCASVS